MDLQYAAFERFTDRMFYKKFITIMEEMPDCTPIKSKESMPIQLKEQLDGTYILTVADGEKYRINIDDTDCLIYPDSIIFPSGSGTQIIIGIE